MKLASSRLHRKKVKPDYALRLKLPGSPICTKRCFLPRITDLIFFEDPSSRRNSLRNSRSACMSLRIRSRGKRRTSKGLTKVEQKRRVNSRACKRASRNSRQRCHASKRRWMNRRRKLKKLSVLHPKPQRRSNMPRKRSPRGWGISPIA
jgi:hypothetical protein